jgi:hypothetical protein
MTRRPNSRTALWKSASKNGARRRKFYDGSARISSWPGGSSEAGYAEGGPRWRRRQESRVHLIAPLPSLIRRRRLDRLPFVEGNLEVAQGRARWTLELLAGAHTFLDASPLAKEKMIAA